MVVLTMVLTALPTILADECTDCLEDDLNEAEYPLDAEDIETTATVAGSSGGSGGTGGDVPTGNSAPIIKAKWEYDLDVVINPEDCDPFPCDGGCDAGNWEHDACPWTPGLQVKPILGCSVLVGYYAVVTDPEGIGTVSAIYADIWHPDGSFKYQIQLLPIHVGDTAGAVAEWEHAVDCHNDLITYNGYDEYEIWDELHQGEAWIFYGEALISYCQPGGWYYVGVRGHDSFGAWSEYLFNKFWYIPTAAIEVDFDTLNYGTCVISSNKWIGGDDIMYDTNGKATVRNIGNTPVNLLVWQDDMQFGMTGDSWNVIYDARLGAPTDNSYVSYEPFQTCDLMPGVYIPGTLDLCTKEKLDFSIHVYKGFPTDPYTGLPLEYSGSMKLFAAMDGEPYWLTPMPFIQNAPLGVPDIYPGP